jgi:chromosome segregation ATPase
MVDIVTRAERRKNPDYRIAELEAEIERLESELLDASRMTSEQEAEIERLQRQLSACKDIDKELGVLRETVERLRAENSHLVDRHNRESHSTASHEGMEVDRLNREVERLRAVLRTATDAIYPLGASMTGIKGYSQKDWHEARRFSYVSWGPGNHAREIP